MGKSLTQVLEAAVRRPRANLSDWTGKVIRLTDGAFWREYFSASSTSGQAVTVTTAMRVAAVWACVRLLAETIASLPIGIYRREDDGGRTEDRSLPLYWVLHNAPNASMTAFAFWEAMLTAMLLWGNAYAEVHRSGGQVIALTFLHPARVRLQIEQNQLVRYFYTPPRGPEREIARADMFHIPAFSDDGIIGLSPITHGAEVFGSAQAANTAANSTFKSGLLPTVAFKVDRVLKREQREEFREYVAEVSGAMNAGKSPVLEQGISTEKIGIPPNDAQLLESRGWSVEEICRFFRVPPFMVGYTEKSTSWGTGLEQQDLGFLKYVLTPWLKRVEQAIHVRLLTPAQRMTHYAEYSLEGLLRADSAARAQFYSQMTQNGIYTRDDCRVRENLPRRGGNADVLTVQSNLTLLDRLGENRQRDLSAVEAVQKAYLGAGKVITSDEARELINQAGAELPIPGPDFSEEQDS